MIFTNDPLRTPLDKVDVEALMRIFGEALDWDRIEGYFQLFDSSIFMKHCGADIMSIQKECDEPMFDTDPEILTQECRKLKENHFTDLPTPDEVIEFLDSYNAFINNAQRQFTPMRKTNKLL